ncbi:hypothetical protein GGR28_002338 [Lewinella aquimaris]|uniref:Uncharacterized protein n=1 Tax=Neolewinella aquimaris TaxID=1835722 RepID=A0A840E6Y2_9BACT|nr:hypothetical protein [Neolewinella aquimaris]MBB4079713.1 hypothetical protein [Neolewinella aquimaris]
MTSLSTTQALLAQRFSRDRLKEDRVIYDPADSLIPLSGLHTLPTVLPQLSFYRTKMTTSFENYYKVEVIVAQPEGGQPVVLWSPLYRNDSPEFTALFVGLQPTPQERVDLGRELAEMYASLYPGGSFVLVPVDTDLNYDLLREGRPFRRLQLHFSPGGKVTAVECIPAVSIEAPEK